MFDFDPSRPQLQRLRARPNNRELRLRLTDFYKREDWRDLSSFICSLPAQAAFDAMRLFGDVVQSSVGINALIRQGDCMSLTIAAATLHTHAWSHRGYGDASEVGEAQWDEYLPRIDHAQELILRANDIDPSNGVTAAWLVTLFFDQAPRTRSTARLPYLGRAKSRPADGAIFSLPRPRSGAGPIRKCSGSPATIRNGRCRAAWH